MSWFYNRKIGTKIIGVYILIAVLFCVVGVYGVNNYFTLKQQNEDFYEFYTIPLSEMSDNTITCNMIYVSLTQIVAANDAETIANLEQTINGYSDLLNKNSKDVASRLKSAEAKSLGKTFLQNNEDFQAMIDYVIGLAKENKDMEAVSYLNGEGNAILLKGVAGIDALVDVISDDAKNSAAQTKDESSKNATIVSVLAVGCTLIGLTVAFIVTGTITKPLKKSEKMITEMSKGHFKERLTYTTKDEIGQMSVAMNNFADKIQHQILMAMKKISEGEININIQLVDAEDEITPTLQNMVKTIQELIDETEKLAIEAENGNLNARGDVSKFKGEYIHIVNAINGTLDYVVAPLQEVTEVMKSIGRGDLHAKVKNEYKGDYLDFVNAVNSTSSILCVVINEINTVLSRISDSDINITEIRDFKGDYHEITVSLNKIVDGLNKTMREIHAAAVQVAAGSGQISDSSVMLSQGSEEQASSIEEVTSAITQMAAQVQENASNATQADTLSKTAKESAINGDTQMQKMLEAMHDINDSSNNISKIIKVIDDIAFQTNILALNAAVEAARAGQYGKGFAVVAEEVRNLAQKSAAAANETTTMIENSIDKVKLGTDIASNTEQALKEILGSVSKSSELVSQIASASNEQASAITQISQAIEQVSGIVQTNSATAEETASASEELTSQAEMLKGMVNKFELRDDIGVLIDATDEEPAKPDHAGKKESSQIENKPQIHLGDF